MSEFVGVVTTAGLAKIAASIGGAALELAVIRVGDGNGAPITPAPNMTDLVRRVGAAYPIIASAADPDNDGHWRVTALIPAEAGPFDIREIGVFDSTGAMIAIARHVLVEKRTLGQGAAVELTTDVVFPISASAQITVQFSPMSAATQSWVDDNFARKTWTDDYFARQTFVAATYLTIADADTTYLTKVEAAATYAPGAWVTATFLSQATAGATYLTKVEAASTYATQSWVTATFQRQPAPEHFFSLI